MIEALRQLRDAMCAAGVKYDYTGHYNIALMTATMDAIKADGEYAVWADQTDHNFLYIEGFRIGDLSRLFA